MPYQVAISRVAQAVISDTGCDGLLHEIVMSASRALDAEIGLVRSISEDGANFVVLNAPGPAPLSIGRMVGSYSVIAEEACSCQPAESIAIDLRSDMQASVLPANERWDLDRVGRRFLLLVPLYSGGQLAGRLDLVRVSSAPFSVETRSQALPFAAYPANALLDRQMRRASDEQQVYQTVVRLAAAGGSAIGPAFGAVLMREFQRLLNRTPNDSRQQLTPREQQFLELLVKGHNNRQIAVQLDLAESTVKNNLSALFQKIGVRDRTQAVLYAISNGLAPPPSDMRP